MRSFTISIVTDYGPGRPDDGEVCLYLEGFDIVSPEKRRQVLATMRRRDRRLLREIRAAEEGE